MKNYFQFINDKISNNENYWFYQEDTFTDKLSELTGFKPHTPLRKGLKNFIKWYREYYDLGNGPEN